MPKNLIELTRDGLPTSAALTFIASSGIPRHLIIKAVGVSPRTLERRRTRNLTAEQSDRFMRMLRVIQLAEDAIGDRERALKWMTLANRSLGGAKPIELLDTDAGARRVETILGRLRDGSVA